MQNEYKRLPVYPVSRQASHRMIPAVVLFTTWKKLFYHQGVDKLFPKTKNFE